MFNSYAIGLVNVILARYSEAIVLVKDDSSYVRLVALKIVRYGNIKMCECGDCGVWKT